MLGWDGVLGQQAEYQGGLEGNAMSPRGSLIPRKVLMGLGDSVVLTSSQPVGENREVAEFSPEF